MKVAGVVLASGFSKRFNGDKLETLLHGRPLLYWAVEALNLFDYRAVVLRRDQLRMFRFPTEVTVLVNKRAERGLSAALKLAVDWVPREADGLAILLGDMPFVKNVIGKILEVFKTGGHRVVAAGIGGKPVNPAVFSRDVFDELLKLEGDIGARALFSKFDVLVVDVDERFLIDVDTENDLTKAAKFAGELTGF